MNYSNFEDFLTGYKACALWSSVDDNDVPFDEDYSLLDLRLSESDVLELVGFFLDEKELIESYIYNIEDEDIDTPYEYLGYDLWLTRNGHWDGEFSRKGINLPEGERDRGLGELGEKLTKIAEDMGSTDVYVGGDNLLYLT